MNPTEHLTSRLGGKVLSAYQACGDEFVTVTPESFREAAEILHRDAGLITLSDLAGVDSLHLGRTPRFEVVYYFADYRSTPAQRLYVKVALPESNPHLPTISDLFKSADWLERECWDQFGIVFDGHPNLRRILNHEDFVGHPLRKDYPVDGRHVLRRASHLE